MHPDDLRLNPRVVTAASAPALRAELARLGFAGDVRDLAPPRMAAACVAMENLSATEAYELRSRWAAGGGEALVAGDPFAATPVPCVLRGTLEQFEKGDHCCPGCAPAAAAARAVRAWGSVPATVTGLEWGKKTRLMGIVNVTPDSFSDGGRWLDPVAAAAHGERLVGAGAEIVDVGGESTRPGAAEVSAEEELARVLPVVKALAAKVKAIISIDTTKSAVARAALDAGAALVNDVSGLRLDPAMAPLVAERGVPAVVMHIQGTPRTMQHRPEYRDPVADICAWLRESLALAARAGVPEERLIVDPGIGFGKALEHNLEILARLREFRSLGRPVLVGASRKSFIGKLTDLPPESRAVPSLGVAAWCIAQGVDVLRVHDVEETEAVRKVIDSIERQ